MLCTNGEHSAGGKGGNGGPGAAADAGVDAGATPEHRRRVRMVGRQSRQKARREQLVLEVRRSAIGCSVAAAYGAPTLLRVPGGNGATQPGNLTATGWTPVNGTNGTKGARPRRGRGQWGQSASMGGGGGGGCGGCGGAAGPGAQSGGSSFAVLSYQSTVTLDACTLVAGAGGNGGKGADGQPGQLGGFGGDRYRSRLHRRATVVKAALLVLAEAARAATPPHSATRAKPPHR